MDENRPIFVIGAPRTGSTYFANLLNSHPRILMTPETRCMVFVNRAIGLLQDQWCIRTHRGIFAPLAREYLRQLVVEFYRQLNTKSAIRWGDKFPHYADPSTDPACLDVIDELFPQAQYLHLTRNPVSVAASIAVDQEQRGGNKAEAIGGAIDVWNRCVARSMTFGAEVGSARYFALRYEDLITKPKPVVEDVFHFLGEPAAEETWAFVQRQRKSPTPFSAPARSRGVFDDVWQPADGRLDTAAVSRIVQATATLARQLDYQRDHLTG